MSKSTLALVCTVFGSVLAVSLALSACQPGAVEENESSTSAGVATCGDRKGCIPVVSNGGSYYTSSNCTGTEYSWIAGGGQGAMSWDGYGLMGNTTVHATTISHRSAAGICDNATTVTMNGFQRIYREAATCSPACGVCQTCVSGACVAIGQGEWCASSVCASGTSSTAYTCHSGACTGTTTACPTTCDPTNGLCTGVGT